ncbi:MAG: glucokinase [Oscillatoriales cyanobacterium CG2_30_44_21]|nr:MAG: glucokinase [Oscillatoriales cyanobacterium CG2_30_44_21]
MQIILAGDIGGTKTLLSLVNAQGLEHLYDQRFVSGNYATFEDLLVEFMTLARSNLPNLPPLTAACFGIAGPVSDRRSQLTNLGWTIESDRLAQVLGIRETDQVNLINDFVAVGYGILGLKTEDLCTLQGGNPKNHAPMAVLGAGTGLGEAYLTWQGDRYEVYATEGGHTDFAPRNELEIELLQYLLKHHHRASVERVVSGLGIVTIYEFLCDRQGNTSLLADGEAIATAALTQFDSLAMQTMQIFVSAYASEAGNLALKLIPSSGLYMAGGIAPKILPLLQEPKFLEILQSKGRVSPVLFNIPIHVVLNSEVGLIGAMIYAQTRTE